MMLPPHSRSDGIFRSEFSTSSAGDDSETDKSQILLDPLPEEALSPVGPDRAVEAARRRRRSRRGSCGKSTFSFKNSSFSYL